MLIYKGKILTKFKNKNGGKNQGEVDGFYRDSDGVEYFVKKPKDPKELFTELFAGLLLQEFMRRQLIDKIYHASFICAQLIQFEDGSYGLIQPKIEFKELYKIIGTGYRDGSDRDPLVEMFYGPQSYLLLTQLKSYFGLAIALMYSLLLGDHSVHSGNVVCLDVPSAVEMMFMQFARIDWGAAFRYFGHKKNNEDLLYPWEYQGWFNPKGYTKGYFLNYKKIKGLFHAIAEQASLLQKKVDESLFVEMVNSVLRQLPADLVDEKTKDELAKYLCIESFGNVNFGEKEQQFSRDLAHILFSRLGKMTVLQDFPINEAESNVQQMLYVESIPTALVFPANSGILFEQQMSIWLNILSLSNERSIFDFNSIDRVKLAKQYNCFLESLLRQMERLEPFLNHEDCSNTLSHSFRNLFTIEMDLKPSSLSYTEQMVSCEQTYWKYLETVLTTSFNAIITIRVLQNTQATTMLASASAVHFLFDALKTCLHDFNAVHNTFLNELETILFLMSGPQLARICLDEMEFMRSSLLIGIVLKSPELWVRMNRALDEEYELLDQERKDYRIDNLWGLHEDYTLFLTLVSELPSITQCATKRIIIDKLSNLFDNLPEFLQMGLATILNQIQDEFRSIYPQQSLDLEELQQLNENAHLALEKNNHSWVDTKYLLVPTNDKKDIDVKNDVLFETISADKILWHAIVGSPNNKLPLDDLLLLKNFYDRKRMECAEIYSEALRVFYARAIQIRLSSVSLTEQEHIMTRDAVHVFGSLPKSTVLDEVLLVINALFGKANDVQHQTISRSLFFSQHESTPVSIHSPQSSSQSLSANKT